MCGGAVCGAAVSGVVVSRALVCGVVLRGLLPAVCGRQVTLGPHGGNNDPT